MNLLLQSWKFFNKHFVDIMIVVLLLLVFNYYVTYPGIYIGNNLPILETTTVTMEKMTNLDKDLDDLDKDVDDKKKKPTKAEKQKEEDVKLHKKMMEDGFCKSHSGKVHELNKNCQRLTADNCTKSSCCVLLNDENENKNTCVAGGKGGPTFLSKDGKPIKFEYYVFEDHCYGDNCPKKYESKN